MPISIQEIRKQYPQYDDMSDFKLLKALHQKHYSDMTFSHFYDAVTPDVDPTEGMSGAQKFFSGAGKATVDLGRGVQQIGIGAANAVPGVNLDAAAARLEQEQGDVNQRDEALMNTGAGMAGNIAGNIATTVIPAGGFAKGAQALNAVKGARAARAFINPMTFRAAAGAGALHGALQPVAEGESRALNAGLGAATGLVTQGAFAGGARVAQPIKNSLSAAGRKAVKVLEGAGVKLDAAQKTGSKSLQRMKASLFDNPVTAGAEVRKFEQQQAAFTRAALRTIGEDSDAATSDVLSNATARIGKVFDDVAARNPVRYDKKLESQLSATLTQAHKELESAQFGVLGRQAEEILNKAIEGGGAIDGAAYANIKQALDRISLGADQSKGFWARAIRDNLDDALERSTSKVDIDALRLARTQWRRFKQIEGALNKDGSGVISPSRLANAIGVKKNAAQAFRGKGDQVLVELAQAGKQILPESLPNSGTAARTLGAVAPTAALGAAAGLASGDEPSTKGALLGLAGGVVAPKALQSAIARKYLSEGLRGSVGTPMRNALMAPQQNALVGTVGRQIPTLLALKTVEQ